MIWDAESVAINIQSLPYDVAKKVLFMRRKNKSVYVSLWALSPKPRYSLRVITRQNGDASYKAKEDDLLERGYKLVIGQYTTIIDGVVVENWNGEL